MSENMAIDTAFPVCVNSIQRRIHEWAVGHGFWEGDQDSVGQKIALLHSEVSELLESERHGNPPCDKDGMEGFSNSEEEAADIAIRLMDLSGRHGWRLGEAIIAKMKVNDGRPHKHGKQF